MKKLPSVKASLAVIVILFVSFLSIKEIDKNKEKVLDSVTNENFTNTSQMASSTLLNAVVNANEIVLLAEDNVAIEQQEEVPEIVYDGMTLEELATKLNRILKSTLSGYGMVFAEYSLKYEVDPYIALAIVLHETGCDSGKCSSLVSKCNNIGGMRGNRACGSSGYGSFKTLEAGMDAFFKNLSENYYKKGLDTPEKIGQKYAESTTWSSRIRYYMSKIEAA